jgi:hypothetical protein
MVEWHGLSQTDRTWQLHIATQHKRAVDCLKVQVLALRLEFAIAPSARHPALALVTTFDDREMSFLCSYLGQELHLAGLKRS